MNGIFRGKVYGTVTIGERGQLVIPADLRKAIRIKSGDQLMVFAKPERKVISIIPIREFGVFLRRAEKIITKLEKKIPKK